MVGCNYFREIKRHSTLKKGWLQSFSGLNTITFKEKNVSEEYFPLKSPSFFVSFPHLVIAAAAVCNFNIYKLIRWELFLTWLLLFKVQIPTDAFFKITQDDNIYYQ